MEILEYFEKNKKIKNKKIDLKLTYLYMKKLYEIIDTELTNIKNKIIDTDSEVDILYNKKYIDEKNKISEILNIVEESILMKRDYITLTYENIELFNDIICKRIISLNEQRKKWGITLNKEIENEYIFACKIQDTYINDFNVIIKKLYPKREEIDNLLKEYYEESQYNNFFIDTEKKFNIHISMKEKDTIMTKINDILYEIDNNVFKKLVENKDECKDLEIVLSNNEIKETLLKIIKALEKNINTGSIINLTVKEYYILKTVIFN